MPPDAFQLLWLLLPVAAASGWYIAARQYRTRHPRPPSSELNQAYFQGFNYLLNEQPDKAIDVFIRALEVDSDTVETHLALGNLFRRRGEVDRAIRIHQNIMARPSLKPDQRYQALLELAQDYQRSGLLDRAEALYHDLLEARRHVETALKSLVEIYEQEQEWNKAIEHARQLQSRCGIPTGDAIAHYFCELAEGALERGDRRQAREHLRQALRNDRDCVRASLLLGRMEQERENCRAAIRHYLQIEEQNPGLLPLALPSLEECHEHLGRLDEYEGYLRGAVERHGHPRIAHHLIDFLARRYGREQAMQSLPRLFRETHPGLVGAERLVSHLLERDGGRAGEELKEVHELLKTMLERRPAYRCERCGFEGKALHWQCPGCKRWNSMVPLDDGC
ncbi:MAG: lipopolysaccharide assembly protein LapB [Gammaproteobacteria bacterium]|nr:MAG: lipopolysaccharide assembly protein LapB [Gammaproteobacteria bacterium]